MKIDEIFVCLFGNKIDLDANREIRKEEAEKFAKDKNMLYFEVSAKYGERIKNLFNDAATCIMDKIKMNEQNDNNDVKVIMPFLDNYNQLLL